MQIRGVRARDYPDFVMLTVCSGRDHGITQGVTAADAEYGCLNIKDDQNQQREDIFSQISWHSKLSVIQNRHLSILFRNFMQ